MVLHRLSTRHQQSAFTASTGFPLNNRNISHLPDSTSYPTEQHRMEGYHGISRSSATPMDMSNSRIVALAKKISSDTEKVDAYFREKGLPSPGFDQESFVDFPLLPADVSRCRREVIHATQELRDLMVGPTERVRWMAWDFMNTQCLQLINHYGLVKIVPLHGQMALSDIQARTTLDPINLTRILRFAITNHVFEEPSPGVIAHTAASRALLEDQELQAWVGFNTEDVYPGSAHVIDALRQYPEASRLDRTGFNFAFDTVDKEPMFVTFGKDPKRAKRMGQAMSSLTGGEGYEVSYLVDNYDFSDVDDRDGTFVDIGGSHGFVCVDLAKKYPHTNFIVQDLPKTVESAPKPICDDLRVAKRINFQAHDFFTEQPVKGADVYFFRWIIHNYSTPYVMLILKKLVPALKPGARIIINDQCLSEPGKEDSWDERLMRGMDLVMMTVLNAQEREANDFRKLFEEADPGFFFKGVTRPKGCRMSIIEAVWKPDEVEE